MKTQYNWIYAAVTALMLCATACSGESDPRPKLAVSIEPQRYILEQIAGDNFNIITVVENQADPETFEPSLKTRRDIDDCEAYFSLAALPFERNLSLSISPDVRIINTTKNIEPIYGTHIHAAENSDFLDNVNDDDYADPHYWASVRNMRQMSNVMLQELQRLDPDNADEYSERYDILDGHLDSLDKAYAKRLADVPVKTFLVWHPTLSYFARDYDLEQLSVTSDNKEVTINDLREVIEETREHGAKVFFTHGYCNEGQAETLQSATGVHRVDIDLMSYDWEDGLEKIVDELTGI